MHYVKEFAKHFLLWTPVAIHIHTEYFRIDRVVGTSMQPTLNPSGSSSDDVVLCELLSGSYYWYQPGDVVLLSSPEYPQKYLVRRLIALQGQTIKLAGKEGKREIPQGCCWVEGDAKGSCDDSATSYGPVPLALIKGRVHSVLWPPCRMRILSRSNVLGERHV